MSFAVLSTGIALVQDNAPAPAAQAAEKKPGPADGSTIHCMAPHKFEVAPCTGPYHHYCKGISPDVLQCLLFESTAPNARFTDVEYFVSKKVSHTQVPLKTWNKYYHDHEVEIAMGRVEVLDMPEAQAKEVAAVAAQTDGIIFHLWPDGAKAPNGRGRPPVVRRTQASEEVSSEL